MIEVDGTDGLSLKNASRDELVKAFRKYDRYFDYGPRHYKLDYRKKIANILEEIRVRKNKVVSNTAEDSYEVVAEATTVNEEAECKQVQGVSLLSENGVYG